MSEKRFTLDDEENGLCRCILVDGEEVPTCEICELLNTLHQENQQLKHYKLYEDNKRLQTIIADLKEENEQLRKQVESSETTSDATSHYNAFLESKISTLEKEIEQLKQKLENIGLNEKNDMIKMVDGKVFMRM